MSIENFEGECFVAFTDISGFKKMMKEERIAREKMRIFYSTGYRTLYHNHKVNGLFISDCGILFSRNKDESKYLQLKELLKVIKKINIEMLNNDVMLTTSIAFGEFSMKNNLEFDGIEKNPIYGDAYVNAYTDTNKKNPKLMPGQCRIINYITDNNFEEDDIFSFVQKKGKYYYYYWNVDDKNKIGNFNKEYKNCFNFNFNGMLEALKKYRGENAN